MVAIPSNRQSSASGAVPRWDVGTGGIPVGFEQITAANLSSPHRLNVRPGATLAIVTIEGSAAIVRWRDDGVAPTATVGMPMAVGIDGPLVYSANITQITPLLRAPAHRRSTWRFMRNERAVRCSRCHVVRVVAAGST